MEDVLTGLSAVLEHDLKNIDPGRMPLLAHYTTLDAFEKIMRNDELWFSHPTFMNDYAEVTGGIKQAQARILECNNLTQAFSNSDGYTSFIEGFEHGITDDFLTGADTFIFSFSEHSHHDLDGRLSMWRGYGADGHGVAIVIDPRAISSLQISPLIFDKVQYLPDADRFAWLDDLFDRIGAYLKPIALQPEQYHRAGRLLFNRIKIASIFSKHVGFKEEEEWRIVYMPDRDVNELLENQLSYFNGPRGLEPKLKFKLQHQPGVTNEDPALAGLIDRIILGPSRASPILTMTAQRLLKECGKEVLSSRVHVSTIPFRTLR